MPVFAKPITYTIKTYQIKLWLANASSKCAMDTNAEGVVVKGTEGSKTSSVATENKTCKNCDGQCGETGQHEEAIKAVDRKPPKFGTYEVKNAVGRVVEVDYKGDRLQPGTSSREIQSKLEDEPWGSGSRWSVEERVSR